MPVVPEVTRLEVTRRRRGLNQAELAAAADVSQGTISVIERGGGTTLRTAQALARALGLSVEELFPPGEPDGPAH